MSPSFSSSPSSLPKSPNPPFSLLVQQYHDTPPPHPFPPWLLSSLTGDPAWEEGSSQPGVKLLPLCAIVSSLWGPLPHFCQPAAEGRKGGEERLLLIQPHSASKATADSCALLSWPCRWMENRVCVCVCVCVCLRELWSFVSLVVCVCGGGYDISLSNPSAKHPF